MSHILTAIALFSRHPRLWRYSVKPLVLSALLFVGLVGVGYLVFVPPIRAAAERLSNQSTVATTVAIGLYAVIWFFLAGTVFLAIASFLSSLGFDRLSIEVEELVGGSSTGFSPSAASQLADGVVRSVFTLVVASIACCFSLFLAGIPGILAAGFISLFDFTASAFLRRGVSFGGQWSRVFRLRGWPTFLLASGLLTLLPFVNVLCLPILVAAGTIMVVKDEQLA